MLIMTKNKLLFVVVIMLFVILSNCIPAFTVKVHFDPLASDFWSLFIKDISNQAITTNNRNSVYPMLHRFIKLEVFKPGIFAHVRFEPNLLLILTRRPKIEHVLAFFKIYYQLSRTSTEKSEPYVLIANYC
jgi:hypothetical protein